MVTISIVSGEWLNTDLRDASASENKCFPQIKRKRTSIKAAVVAEIAKSYFGTVSNFPMDAKEKLGPLINTDCKGEHFFNLHVWYRVWQIFKYILILIQFSLCIHIYLCRHFLLCFFYTNSFRH